MNRANAESPDLEQDAIEAIEAAQGAMKNSELYDELRRRGHKGTDATLRKKLKAIKSIDGKNRGEWRLVELVQGEGDTDALSNFICNPTSPYVLPPINSSIQQLPLEDLHWEDFEQLCVHLLDKRCELGTVQPYGLQGQNQLGIDVLGFNKRTQEYEVIQCKCYKGLFSKSDLEAAVTRFLDGKWRTKSKRLILAVTKDTRETGLVDEENKQRERLKAEGIEFEVWDKLRMTRLLKCTPELIDAFFGAAWHHVLCPTDKRRQVYLLDATSELGKVKSDNSPEAFNLAALKSNTKAEGSVQSARLRDISIIDDVSDWDAVRRNMETTVQSKIEFWSEENPDIGIAVFPFARVSLLFCLGMVLGDQKNIDLYRWERDRNNWVWDDEDQDLQLQIEQPSQLSSAPNHVAVLICITTNIYEPDVQALLKTSCGEEPIDVWRLKASDDSRVCNNIHHPNQVSRFKKKWLRLLRDIEENYGSGIELHLFIAAAAPIVVAAGQCLLTRGRPKHIHLHEFEKGTHYRVLTV